MVVCKKKFAPYSLAENVWSSGSLAQQRRLFVERHQKQHDAVLEVG